MRRIIQEMNIFFNLGFIFVENKIPGLSPIEVNNILSSIAWETWMYQTGLPPYIANFTTTESD